MIKVLILDVDGVLVGNKNGYNWPDPHPTVIQTLKSLRKKGLIVSLCSGKGTFAIQSIVKQAHLDNAHIGDGGAIIIDFLKNKIITQHIIDDTIKQNVIPLLLQHNIYTELYTKDGYFVQKEYVSDKTVKHTDILNKLPTIVPSLLQISQKLDVVKIMPVADNESDKQKIIDLFSKKMKNIPLQWGVHPTALPYQFGIITASGISKKQATKEISDYYKIPLENFLGIGDGMTDWQFMEICGFAGAMGNGSQDLKDIIATKGKNGFVGSSVNDHGVLDILKHFSVIK